MLTFSRSAWLATALVIVLVVWWNMHVRVTLFVKRWWPLIAALLIVAGIGLFSVRESSFFQGYIIHTTEVATTEDNSTELHYMLAREGLEAAADQPLGYGPGTAGLASIHSPDGQLTENYYIQVLHEVGVIGLAVFVAISVVVYRRLWARHDNFGIIMISCFWGYVVTNMLLHSWANEAIAAQWWLLAGIALAARDRKVTHTIHGIT